MVRALSIGSGSSGNSFYLELNGKKLLIDMGLSARAITAGLRSAGTGLEELDAVLITHTHSDHISALPVCSKKLRCPVYSSELSRSKLFRYDPRVLPPERPVEIAGGVTVTAFETSHDCPGSMGFRIDHPEGSFGYATDLGCVTDRIRQILRGVDTLVLEANHDVQMLRDGPYPYVLKRRILSDGGHLSNDACAEAARWFALQGTRNLFFAHLSRENNSPDRVLETLGEALRETGAVFRILPPVCDHQPVVLD